MTFSAWMLISCLAGCAGEPVERSNYPQRRAGEVAHIVDPQYQVGVGDKLAVAFSRLRHPETFVVERDGCIYLKNQRSVRVDGLTVAEIAVQIHRTQGYVDGTAAVRVVDYRSQFIYLCKPGMKENSEPIPYRGRESLTSFLRRSGCTPFSAGFRARVVRRADTIGAAPLVLSAELDENFQERGASSQPIVLAPNDYVYIDKAVGNPGRLTRLTENSRRLFRADSSPQRPMGSPVRN